MKKLFLSLLFIFFFTCILSYSQETANYYNSNTTNTKVNGKENRNVVPGYFISELQKARKQENEKEVRRIEKLIDGYYEKKNYNYLMPDASPAPLPSIVEDKWLPNDIILYNDSLKGTMYNMDLKKGKDGYLYAALIGKPQTGYKGLIQVYKSSNGGLSWSYVNGIQDPNYYYGQISLLVEKNGTVDDSVRILVYYCGSLNPNLDNALIGCMSFRRDGQGWYNNVVVAPSTGNRFLYPSACSDGAYNNAFAYMHVVFVVHGNGAGSLDTLYHCRTTDWGKTHTLSKFGCGGNLARFPSAAMKAYYSSEDDTIYVAVTNYDWFYIMDYVRIIKTTGTPSSNMTSVTAYPGGINSAMKPKLTIVQQNIPANQKKMFLTFLVPIADTSSGKGAYGYSLGGTSWSAVQYFSNSYIKYANCTSDTNTATADYILVTSSNSGDSLMVRRGSFILLGSPVKVNSSPVSIYSIMAPAIFTVGTTKYSSVLYAGSYNFRAYFDGENLTTGIKKVTNKIPDKFSLSQNYPNPFNPATKIKFSIPSNVKRESSNIKLIVFDILGKEVAVLVNENLNAGIYEVSFDGSNLSSGIYFYKMEAGDFSEVKRMILIK